MGRAGEDIIGSLLDIFDVGDCKNAAGIHEQLAIPEKPTSHPHPQSPIGPPRKIGKTLVIFLSHGLLSGTPRPVFSRVMGYFFGPLGNVFKSHGLLFGDP